MVKKLMSKAGKRVYEQLLYNYFIFLYFLIYKYVAFY